MYCVPPYPFFKGSNLSAILRTMGLKEDSCKLTDALGVSEGWLENCLMLVGAVGWVVETVLVVMLWDD